MRSESPSISPRNTAEQVADEAHAPVTFHLGGPTAVLDGRVNAYRRDIADIALAGKLFAPHYAAPMHRGCALPSAMIRSAPDAAAEAVSQLLSGECFAVLDLSAGWAWGYSEHDHYTGYVEAAALGCPLNPTHRVRAREALLFAEASIKSAARAVLSFGALVKGDVEGTFLRTDAGFIHMRHLADIGTLETDPVAVAEALLGAPYLWGGRGAGGIDCSGLVQIALAATGVDVARDTDQQREQVGEALPEDARLRRGDIVHFPGHVGLMVDEDRLIHANAHWMAVVVEPLADVVARLAPHHDRPILGRRRL
jgi:hypothetical protein